MKYWLLLVGLSGPVSAQTNIPSLDDYALPRRAGVPSGQVLYQVQSQGPITLRANEPVSIPVWDNQRVTLGQLKGKFIPEGEVAGRLVFNELQTPQGTFQIAARTDLLPAQGNANVPDPDNGDDSAPDNVNNYPSNSYNPPPNTSYPSNNYNNPTNNYNYPANNYNSYNPYSSLLGMGRGRRRGFGRGIGGGLGGLNSLGRRSSYNSGYGGNSYPQPYNNQVYNNQVQQPFTPPLLTSQLQPGQSLRVIFDDIPR